MAFVMLMLDKGQARDKVSRSHAISVGICTLAMAMSSPSRDISN